MGFDDTAGEPGHPPWPAEPSYRTHTTEGDKITVALNSAPSLGLRELQQRITSLRDQLADAEAEEHAQKERLETKAKEAGIHYAALVQSLYDRLGIEPEHTAVVDTGDGPVEVPTDPDEKQRVERLSSMLTVVLHDADPGLIMALQMDDAMDRDRRRDERAEADSCRVRGRDWGESR